MSTVTKSVANDFSGVFDASCFDINLKEDEILSSVYLYLTRDDDIINIYFSSVLSGVENTELSNVIANFQKYLNNMTLEQGSIFTGEIQVGSLSKPSELAIGEGNAYTVGMIILRETDQGIFDNVTDIMKNLEGETGIFSSNLADSAFFIGGNSPFYRIKYFSGDTGIDYGSTGSILWEYGDNAVSNSFTSIGATLINGDNLPFMISVRDAMPPYYVYNSPITGPNSRSPDPFSRMNASEHIKFGFMKNWVKTTVNSILKYWVRCRIINDITTIPSIKKIKIGKNCTIFEEDGFIQKYGDSIGWEKLNLSLIDFKTSSLFTTPSSSPIFCSSNIGISLSNNVFTLGVQNGVSTALNIPEDFNNALPIIIELRYIFDTTPILTPTVKFKLIYNYTNIGSSILTTIGGLNTTGEKTIYPMENNTDLINGVNTSLIISGTPKQEQRLNFVLNLSDFHVNKGSNVDHDTLWISLIRDGLLDTYTGNIIFFHLNAIFPSNTSGTHRLALPSIGLF